MAVVGDLWSCCSPCGDGTRAIRIRRGEGAMIAQPYDRLGAADSVRNGAVRPEPGPGRTAVCRPVRSFSKVARQVRIKDEDGRHSVVPSGLF